MNDDITTAQFDIFKRSLMDDLCEKAKERISNQQNPLLEHKVADIVNSRRRMSEPGFNITSYGVPEIKRCLRNSKTNQVIFISTWIRTHLALLKKPLLNTVKKCLPESVGTNILTSSMIKESYGL